MEVTTLLTMEVSEALADPVSLFVGRVTWEPEARSGVLNHPAAVGLVVTRGELTVRSPSGIEGSVGVDHAVAIPASTPLDVRNGGSQPATALLFGLHRTGTDPFSTQDGTPPSTASPASARTALLRQPRPQRPHRRGSRRKRRMRVRPRRPRQQRPHGSSCRRHSRQMQRKCMKRMT